jgi:hypothetical protein
MSDANARARDFGDHREDPRHHVSPKVVYGVVAALLAVLLVVMLIAFDYDRRNTEAVDKADELITQLQANGLAAPDDAEDVADLLGDDGGSFCAVDYDGQYLGQIKNSLGVGGEFFFRASSLDDDTIKGLEIIVGIYCPDKLPDVQDLADDLDLDDDLVQN